MQNNEQLLRELDKVSVRYRRLLLMAGLATVWLALAAVGLAVLAWTRGGGYAVPGFLLVALVVLPLLIVPIIVRALRIVRDPMWIARRVETKFPDLDAKLLAAVEQHQASKTRRLGYLEQTVVEESLAHARQHRWLDLVSAARMRTTGLAHALLLVAFVAVVVAIVADVIRRPGSEGFWAGGPATQPVAKDFEIKVEPEDTSVERGTGLIVLARFGERMPGDVQLLLKDGAGQTSQLSMAKSLDDPIFAGRTSPLQNGLTYAIRYAGQQTRWYKVGVYEHPELEQADAKLNFPTYTGLEEKVVQDVRTVTAVEGTKATLTLRLNKPVTEAVLIPAPRKPIDGAANTDAPTTQPSPVKLVADPANPNQYTAAVDMTQSQTYRLQLKDEDGRDAKRPAQLALNVTANRPPELKLEFPAKDVDVSPIEEMTVKAKVWDDFGVKRVGMSYGIAGQPPKDVVLAEGVAAKDRKDVAHTVALEKMSAEPDQLLSYYLWVEDNGPDGKIRRTSGDMFFAEVRPFEEIFRQGEQPSEEPQEEQQKQASQNAQQAEENAEKQKEIIAATWKVMRREIAKDPTPQFVPDVKLIAESQAELKEKTAGMAEKLTDERSKSFLASALKHMDNAVSELTSAAGGPAVDRLPNALSAEQAAYQDLLKLRAREHEVVRKNSKQKGQPSQSSASSRKQRQLDQLKLDQEQNRYEQQRTAQQQAQQQQQEAQARETRQVLSRLRELAQRQEDLNKQMKELQSALDAAKEEAKKEEIKRQLARLRDQQREMLQDTDQLRDRMEQPENQERMAEAKDQLDKTREDVRKAAEALEQNKTQEASAAGARAEQKLNQMKEEFRRQAAGQFGEAVENMRQEARQLDQKQQELSDQLAEMNGQPRPQRQQQQPNQPGQQPQASAGQRQPGQQQGQQPQAGQQPGAGEPQDGSPQGQPQQGEAQAGQPGQGRAGQGQSGQGQSGQGQSGQAQSGQARAGQPRGGQQRLGQPAGQPGDAQANAGQPGEQPQPGDPSGEPNAQTGQNAPGQNSPGQNRPQRPSLRAGEGKTPNRERIAQDLEQQRQKLESLLENMRQTIEKAEATEPLLSKQLYDTVRNVRQERADEAIDAARRLVDRGFVGEAQQAGEEAAKSVTKLREGVEKAAKGVLGDEDEALRRARAEVDALAQQLDREMGRNGQPPAAAPATRPALADRSNGRGNPSTRPAGDERQLADGGRNPRGGPTTRPGEAPQATGEQPNGQQPGERQPRGGTTRPAGEPAVAQGNPQPGQNPPQGQQQGQTPRQGQPGQQGQPQMANAGQQPGAQPGQGQQPGQQGQQPGQQPGQGQQAGEQPGQPGQGNPPGQAQAQQQGQPGQGRQPGQRQPGLRGGNTNDQANPAEVADRGPGAPSDEGRQAGPLTGEGFREWADRLRDVEEMVSDPRLRAEAARIRERAKAVRAEVDRHSKEPNWDLVRNEIGLPLAELRKAITEELLRRQGGEALVPIDREPVPPEFAEQVRKYYERLGAGK
ncbi:DUF4175 family protein [Humisphaera borealis]|uniref:DUF4175 family protein n=1 Tax=Humisphaera borealis TaxID=2807512 RepID=A0A7M2WU12_9BACT|nr:DUF4175 family protein [Humisphaera borealis]QOV88291.1 hypothetical protein IPV69_18835 [Humisphaera borealis]